MSSIRRVQADYIFLPGLKRFHFILDEFLQRLVLAAVRPAISQHIAVDVAREHPDVVLTKIFYFGHGDVTGAPVQLRGHLSPALAVLVLQGT